MTNKLCDISPLGTGSEARQNMARILHDQEREAAKAMADRLSSISMPEDMREAARRWGVETLMETVWSNAFQRGFREALFTSGRETTNCPSCGNPGLTPCAASDCPRPSATEREGQTDD